MAKSQPKIALSESRDIPFDKLVLSQCNVRRVKAGVAIEELAEDIARRTLAEEIPEEVDARLGEIETALGEFEERPVVYDASEIARAGVFISIGTDGTLHVERGYVRPRTRSRWRRAKPRRKRKTRARTAPAWRQSPRVRPTVHRRPPVPPLHPLASPRRRATRRMRASGPSQIA